jgi:hypothetical protein
VCSGAVIALDNFDINTKAGAMIDGFEEVAGFGPCVSQLRAVTTACQLGSVVNVILVGESWSGDTSP